MSAAMKNATAVIAAILTTTSLVFGAVLTPAKPTTNDKVPSDGDASIARHSSYVSPLTSLLNEMRSTDGWNLGAGLSLHLDTVNQDVQTKSLLERRAVRLDFDGIGMRIGKAIGKDEFDVGFYTDGGQSRGKNKHSELLLHAMFGFNIAGMVAFTLAAFGALVLKSIAVAKVALAVAAYMMLKKLFGGEHSGHLMRQSYELMEPHPSDLHPAYIDYNYSPAYGTYGYPPSGAVDTSPGSNPYLSYTNYGPTGANSDVSSDSTNIAYAIAEPPTGNVGSPAAAAANLVASSVGQQKRQNQQHQLHQQQVQRRRDIRRKPHKPQHVTLNKYTKVS